MLRRKATWIDKSVNLKQVLKDPRALRALQDFAISIHAGENVAAWVVRSPLEPCCENADVAPQAIEFFKIQHISTPKSRTVARKRLSEQLGNLHLGDEDEDPVMFTHANPNKNGVPDAGTDEGMNEAQRAIHKDATRIFRTFFEEGAPHWCCVDDHVISEMRNTLKSGEALDVSFFSHAQQQIFQMMQNDTFPRFIKAVLADPDRFSTGERLEIDAATREHLDKILEGSVSESPDRSARVRSLRAETDRVLNNSAFL